MSNRRLKDYALVSLKGMGMGAADIVPGVSGGTIAFISGIYEELLNSLKSIPKGLQVLFKEGLVAFWKAINGNFLLALFIGIGISLVSLVKLIHYLLDNEPVLIWSFFFGLIIASIITIAKQIKNFNVGVVSVFLVGAALGYFISIATPAETPTAPWFIFLSGMIAICAMILPGISGSFILLLLKKYKYVTGAIKDFDIATIAIFGAGAVIGLLSFAQVLSWLFKKFHNATVSFLIGIMLGSLNVVWPWKEVLETRVNSKGEEVPFRYESVSPFSFTGDNQLVFAVVVALIGFSIIYFLDRYSRKLENRL